MSTIETIDKSIEQIIKSLVKEFEATGFLSAPSSDRKNEIIETIAKLRASMSPQCDCKK
jgi:hypothetical protein